MPTIQVVLASLYAEHRAQWIRAAQMPRKRGLDDDHAMWQSPEDLVHDAMLIALHMYNGDDVEIVCQTSEHRPCTCVIHQLIKHRRQAVHRAHYRERAKRREWASLQERSTLPVQPLVIAVQQAVERCGTSPQLVWLHYGQGATHVEITQGTRLGRLVGRHGIAERLAQARVWLRETLKPWRGIRRKSREIGGPI